MVFLIPISMKFAKDAEQRNQKGVILTNPLIDQIKTRLSILEALERYGNVTPRRKGNSYWCSCLQKQERTPSMQIFPDRDYYRCFSCGAYGDQIDLVAEALNFPLWDVIQLLAEDLGLDETISQEERKEINLERARRRQEGQKLIDQQNIVKQEYRRLIAIERQMCSFIMSIESGLDLNRTEVIESLRNKELIGYWIDSLLDGKLDEQLKVVEVSKNFEPWKEAVHEKTAQKEMV